jgi:hypothetical protein
MVYAIRQGRYLMRQIFAAGTRASLLLALSFISFSSLASVAAPDSNPQPKSSLRVTLIPHGDATSFRRIDVEMVVEHPDLKAGASLLQMPVILVGCPSAAYTTADISARDELGSLSLTQIDDAATPHDTMRHWTANRTTKGNVTLRFGSAPRPVSIATRNGPLYDLRAQGSGMMGAGHYFIPELANQEPYRISIRWDLTNMPAGSRGVSSFGEGQQDRVAKAEVLASSYYAAGPIGSEPANGDSKFTFYWIGKPAFDVKETAEYLHRLYSYIAHFFGDEESSYRIFMRSNPYPGFGGTALNHSFMYGYGPDGGSKDGFIRTLLAHEMVHNWPEMTGRTYSDSAWYNEGTAEFYSAVLPLRAGLISEDEFLDLINDHAVALYTSPYLGKSLAVAAENAWTDDDAENVPYNRGFMYLAITDAKIRTASHGLRSVDDLVLKLERRTRQGEHVSVNDWLKLLSEQIGPDAYGDYEAMASGRPLVPLIESFGPCFRPVKTSVHRYDPGFDPMRLAVVSNLRPDSPGAKAGLKNGDRILQSTSPRSAEDSQDHFLQMKVERNGLPMTFSFSPFGPPVDGWKWIRSPHLDRDVCGP